LCAHHLKVQAHYLDAQMHKQLLDQSLYQSLCGRQDSPRYALGFVYQDDGVWHSCRCLARATAAMSSRLSGWGLLPLRDLAEGLLLW
jgi:hypothetical protein